MTGFMHQIFSGLAAGGIYAALALALVMVYRATRHLNFAQGEMATFSTYIALSLIETGLPYWLAFVVTVAVSFALGVALERLLLRRLAHAPGLAAVGVSIGLLLIFNAASGWLFGFTIKRFPSPFEASGGGVLGGLMSRHELGMILVTLLVLLAVYAFFRHTSLGLAMRAAAANPESSRLVGIRVGWTLALGWGLAAALGAVAGMMVAPVVFLDPNMMSGVLLYAFAGALLGGIDNPPGAVLGGFAVGVIENLGGAYLVGTDLKLTLALAIIAAVLVLRPAGLFGRAAVARV
jgi:branched-chain amino acid transport system permease protein